MSSPKAFCYNGNKKKTSVSWQTDNRILDRKDDDDYQFVERFNHPREIQAHGAFLGQSFCRIKKDQETDLENRRQGEKTHINKTN